MRDLDLSRQHVCVTGGAGFLGRIVCRQLLLAGLPDEQLFVPRRKDFDLTRDEDVQRLYDVARPTVVVHLAAEVGGIGANRDHPGRFFYANLAMGLHLIEHGRRRGITKFVQVGTVCAYPKFTPVPFREQDLWDGYPEETNAPYGIAKKSLFVMLDAYHKEYAMPGAIVVPVNLYGPGDNFHPQTSHVIPALIRKIHDAKTRGEQAITCWGTGNASREFLYVDDAAAGVVAATIRSESPEPINLGTGREITIRDLVHRICKIYGYSGAVDWDSSKPDGQPRRCVDVSRAKEKLNWEPTTRLDDGLRQTVQWWQTQLASRVHSN